MQFWTCLLIVLGLKFYPMNGYEQCPTKRNDDENTRWKFLFSAAYKENACPRLKNGPMELLLGVYPRGIPEMSIEKMYLEIDVYIILIWSDCRLSFPDINKTTALPDDISTNLWHPKIYFGNGLGATPITFVPDILAMTVNTKFQLSYAKRTIIPFYCEFDLSSYPMDVQRCELQILPIEHSSVLTLKEFTQLEKEISLKGRTPPHFAVRSSRRGPCKPEASLSTDSDCLALIFILERSVSYYLTVIYFPSMLIVSLTWVSFWLDIDASAPRVTLGLTSLLTLSTQFANVQNSLPPVSYVKAVDVWMLACMILVFASLVEFAVANYIHRREKTEKPQNEKFLTIKNYISQDGKMQIKTTEGRRVCPSPTPPPPTKINIIDNISRKIFPISFILFNIIYWSYYLYLKYSLLETL